MIYDKDICEHHFWSTANLQMSFFNHILPFYWDAFHALLDPPLCPTARNKACMKLFSRYIYCSSNYVLFISLCCSITCNEQPVVPALHTYQLLSKNVDTSLSLEKQLCIFFS